MPSANSAMRGVHMTLLPARCKRKAVVSRHPPSAYLLFGAPDGCAGAMQALRRAAEQRLRLIRSRQIRRRRPRQLQAAALLRRARGAAAGGHVACIIGALLAPGATLLWQTCALTGACSTIQRIASSTKPSQV